MTRAACNQNCISEAATFHKESIAKSPRMKIASVFVILVSQCLLFSSFLAQISLAAPTSQAGKDVVAVTSDAKRDAEYRNLLFGAFACRVKKAADVVRTKLQVISL